jgi:ABC-type nitrate/sulfonate/bicarbonate transport system substrate-binding protein
MQRFFTRILLAILLCSPVFISHPLRAAQAKKLRLAFSAFAYANPPFWIAHELKLFEKYGGYETELVYVGVTPAGGSPEVLAGLLQGKFPAGVLTPPTSTMAAKQGHREIFDLASLDFPFPVISVVSSRRFIDANPEVILNILRATGEAIYLYKSRPELTVPVVAKYMRVAKDDPAVVEAQRTIGQLLNQNLPPSLEGVRFLLDHYAERQPSLINKSPADFVDMRFVRKLEEAGFFKQFAGK